MVRQDRKPSPLLIEHENLDDKISVNRMISAHQVRVPRSLAESLPEHQAILEALSRRDPEASETAMRVHIRRSVERLWQRARAEEADR